VAVVPGSWLAGSGLALLPLDDEVPGYRVALLAAAELPPAAALMREWLIP
jgi:DNA-binding transcriptional LysR family regulator